jgi:hypothetical protein
VTTDIKESVLNTSWERSHNVKKYMLMYEKGKLRPIEIILGI